LYPLQKFGKWQNKVFPSIDLVRIAPDLFGHSQEFFCHYVDLLGIKRRRILCRIQKCKLSLVKIAPKKGISEKICKK
jgi:hypothetical protein